MLIGAWIGVRLYGYTRNVDNFQILFMWATLVPLCAIGVVLGWRTFVELETPDGPDADIHLELPRSASAASTTFSRRHPLLLLALKELRLQQLAWILGLIYALLYVGFAVWRRVTPESDVLGQVLTMFFGASSAIVLGAVTTAGERQLGTYDMQLLQPIPAWQRWFVKTGMALASAGILAVLLPDVLLLLFPPGHPGTPFARGGLLPPQMIWLIGFVVATSVYVSALSATTMRALTATVAVLVFVVVFFQRVMMFVVESAWRYTHTSLGRGYLWGSWLTSRQQVLFWSLFIGALVLLILRLASVNHRRPDWGVVRIGLQVAAIALVAITGFALAAALGIR